MTPYSADNLDEHELWELRNAIIDFGEIIIKQVNESRDYNYRKIRTVHESNWEIREAIDHIIGLVDRYAKEDTLNIEEITEALDAEHPFTMGNYAIVELYGHRRRYGFVVEYEQFGTKWVKIEQCAGGMIGFGVNDTCEPVEIYAPSAVFSISPITREHYDELVAPKTTEGHITALPPPEFAGCARDDPFGDD